MRVYLGKEESSSLFQFLVAPSNLSAYVLTVRSREADSSLIAEMCFGDRNRSKLSPGQTP